jgi:hypothetical protein
MGPAIGSLLHRHTDVRAEGVLRAECVLCAADRSMLPPRHACLGGAQHNDAANDAAVPIIHAVVPTQSGGYSQAGVAVC